jgi:hypothetical protein
MRWRNLVTELPTGTVTFLFTDIEGSTALAQQFPAKLPIVMARHRITCRCNSPASSSARKTSPRSNSCCLYRGWRHSPAQAGE